MIRMNRTQGSPITPHSFNTICRLCLTSDEKLFQLFRSEEIETSAIPLSMKATLCTAIRMSKQDILPQKICQNCINFVNEWFTFKKKCVRNDIYLKKCLSHTSAQNATQSDNADIIKDCDLDLQENGAIRKLETFLETGATAIEAENVPTSTAESSLVGVNPVSSDILFSESEFDKTGTLADIGIQVLKPPRKKFQCPSCPTTFYALKDMKLHKSIVHKSVKSEKSASKEQFPIKDDYLKLDEANVRNRYEMKCCEKVFFSKARFRRHFNKKHPGEKPYMCETCGKKGFISEETLKRHKILHTGKYKCDICSKTFTCNAILIIHKRDKHENDKPFICDVCGKRFVTELLMNYHKRFHTGEKKYVCEECGLAVVTSSSLAKHKRIHSNVKPHICQVCGKGFIIKGRLVEHLRVHTGERPYSCHICHKGFTMRDKLKRHIRIHSGEKLFSCEYCGNNYSTSYGLTVHLKSHIVRNY